MNWALLFPILKPNVGGLVGYNVKFPQSDPIFLAITEIELVKAAN